MALVKENFREKLFKVPCNSFKDHLTLENNKRIIFSGRFGIGKSYFLNHFFKEDVQTSIFGENMFNVFHLYPVNYSIASNEDIFRYIKYDIITTMLQKDYLLFDKAFSAFEALPWYLTKEPFKILGTISAMIPKIGKDIFEVYEKIEELNKGFKIFREENKPEGEKLIDYQSILENQPNSIFENDLITKIIKSAQENYKQESGKENILVIDDLDRIDPDHIFRLLNVFAAHLDIKDNISNKLGFDRIILVCDIENIRNIFRSKYGLATDFNGYIDKFYSCEVYYFDNREVLREMAFEAFKSITSKNPNQQDLDYYRNTLFRKSNLPIELLQVLIAYGFVNLRSLLIRISTGIRIEYEKIVEFDSTYRRKQIETPFLLHFRILRSIAGEYGLILEHLSKIPDAGFAFPKMNQYCASMLFYLNYAITFTNKGDLGIVYNGEQHIIRVDRDYDDEISKVRFFANSIPKETEYKFTTNEFRRILSDFLHLLSRINN